MPDLDRDLQQILNQEKDRLAETQVPIVTVSASFKEDLKKWYGLPDKEDIPDIVFSRAHYSMAAAIASQAWGDKLDPKKAWVVDPTNYVKQGDWNKIELTEFVGKTLARHSYLKKIKDIIDRFGRNQLPILKPITPSLLYLTDHLHKPILSLHIATGNILVANGKTVIQVVTDPHIRYDYLEQADNPKMFFCVFDEKTKTDFVEKAALLDKKVDPNRIFVTGSPIDPRVSKLQDKKRLWKNGTLRVCLTTGGLGTNKPEIEQLLHQLLPLLKQRASSLQLVIYAGTQLDIYRKVTELASHYRIKIGASADTSSGLRVLHHPQIVDANELLLKYGFAWADLFITKPSGDMAYDAAAAGCAMLTLKEWGEWEFNVREVFEQRNISRPVEIASIIKQLQALSTAQGSEPSWIAQAQTNARELPPLFTRGSANILKVVRDLT